MSNRWFLKKFLVCEYEICNRLAINGKFHRFFNKTFLKNGIMRSAGTGGLGSSSSSEGAWPRVGRHCPLPSESSMSTTVDTATSTSRPSLTSSISRFRSDFEQLKCKARIFGESMNLCRCIADDFNKRLAFMEKRLVNLEQRQRLTGESNYSAIIQKNQKLSHKTKQDVKKLQMCGSEEEMREVAGRICRNYLHGAWKTVDPRDLDFKRISGGLSNFLYYVALPESRASYRDAPQDRIKTLSEHSFSLDEPKKVLLRIYGQVHGERAMDAIVTESVIFTLLSERRLGPKLHGVFSGGRIEEYIPARSLLTKELSEPALSMKIAEKMAAIHSMEVPLSKEPNWLWKTMSKWLRTAREERFTAHDLKGEERKIMERLRSVEWEAEIEWVRKLTGTVNSPVVFCHNDMQEGNVLLVEEETSAEEEEGVLVQTYPLEDSSDSVASSLSDLGEPRLMLIDFEYCAYNHRAFDIANHFQEWSYDYSNSQHPFYFEYLDQEPTLEQKEIFIKEYLKAYRSCWARAGGGAEPEAPSVADINQLLGEVDAFQPVCDLFWSLWSVVNASKSQIPFGYWEFALSRLETYLRLKRELIKKEKCGLPHKRKICEVDI